MKPFFVLLIILIKINVHAQNNFYAANKTGLSMRDKPSISGKVLDKIAYGQKLDSVYLSFDEKISTEGFNGYWYKVSFNKKMGYVVSSYLLPEPPPKDGIKTFKAYLNQISKPAGKLFKMVSGSTESMSENGFEMEKQLYENGAEWHTTGLYEAGSETYFLPQFDIQQTFLVARILGEFKNEIGEKDLFPTKNTFTKIPEGTKTIKVDRYNFADKPVNKITIDVEDGPFSTIEIFMMSNQAVLHHFSGV